MPIHTAAILAGGLSRRMGADKALLPFAGIPLLERAARTAAQVCPNLLVIGRTAPPNWPVNLPAQFLPDFLEPRSPDLPPAEPQIPPGGPLLGLITALQHARQPLLLLACDTPLLTPTTLRALLAAHDPAALATIATTHDPAGHIQAEPTLAIYTPALLPLLQKMLAENRRSLQPLLHHPGVKSWPLPADKAQELFNLNDPAAFQAAEDLLNAGKLDRG